MRRSTSLLVLLATVLAGCADVDPAENAANEIVFGVSQRLGADGAPQAEADYAYLGIAGQPNGGILQVFAAGAREGTCYFERFDPSVARAPSDPGRAVFSGGSLPAGGLAVAANQAGATELAGAGWASGDRLRFQVSGFALPPLPEVVLPAPVVSLGPIAVAPGGGVVAADDDVAVTWTPSAAAASRIMVALDTETAGTRSQLRCFTGGSAGSLVVPHAWVARLFDSLPGDAAITGHLRVATHEQVTVVAPGNWNVYVVATTVQHDLAFTGTRNRRAH